MRRLGEVCVVDKSQGVHQRLPYVGLEDIESHSGRFIGSTQPRSVKSSTFKFSQDHVLYGRLRPYLNKVVLPEFIGHCSTEIFPLKPRPGLSREFLQYWLLNDETVDLIDATSTGARMPRANMNAVLNFDFPLPPLDEQRRIVGILGEALEGITTAKANAEKNLQNSRALFESRLQFVFGETDGDVRLVELCETITDGDHMPPPKSSSGVPFITISNIAKDKREIDFSDTFMVPEEYFGNLKANKKPKPGDVLYTVTGATLGIPVLVTQPRDFCFQRHIGLLRPKRDTDSRWLAYAMLSPQVFRQATAGSTGAAQKTVSLAVLRSITVPLIPPSVQNVVADELDSLSRETQRLESICQRKLAALDELKKSLLSEAFAGKL